MNEIAFVIGNGTSRASINLSKLKSQGKIYGCNALYRDFDPDILVCVDTKMVIEINNAKYQHSHEVWTNPNKLFHNMTGFNFFNPGKGWSSGPTALWKASQDGFDEIYILGFDYEGIDDKINNMYADTANYRKSTDKATYFGNWQKQTYSTIYQNRDKRYIRVIQEEGYIPREFSKLYNLKHMNITDFCEKFAKI